MPVFRQNLTLPPVCQAGVSVSLGTTQPQEQEAQKGHWGTLATPDSGGRETAGYAGGF